MQGYFYRKSLLWLFEDVPNQLTDSFESIAERVVVNAQHTCRFSVVLVAFEEDTKRVEKGSGAVAVMLQ